MTVRVIIGACVLVTAAAVPQPPDADRLVDAVLASRTIAGFRARATLIRTVAGTDHEVTKTQHLVITGRRDGRHTSTLYRIVAPKEAAGRALLVDDPGTHHLAVTEFKDRIASTLAPDMVTAPFFDSDLRIEDVVEGYWYWRSRSVVGDATIDRRRCRVVEFRPPPDVLTAYSRIQACVSPELALPLRVTDFGRDDAVDKQLTAARITRRDGRWVAGRLFVEPAGAKGRTVFEGTRFDGTVVPPASDFTVAAVSRTLGKGE